MTADPRAMAVTLRGRYERRLARERDGVCFELTRVSEDGTAAYGWYTYGDGKPIDGTPLVRIELNKARTAPDGWRKVEQE